MDKAETTKKKPLTKDEIIQELMDLLKQNNMQSQSNEVFEICSYVDGLEKKLDSVTEELTKVRDQIKEMQEDRDMVITYYNSLAKSFKYTCLSDTDENNMPMWAYYANNHQGFCVEYLLCEMQKKYIFPVTYEPERVSANAITTNLLYEYMKMKEEGKNYTDTSADANLYLQMMILSLAAKHKSWEHEKEYRIICHRDDFPAIPSKIYIGLNCKEEYRKLLTEVGKSIEVCKVYEMKIDDISSRFGFKQKLIT